MTAILIHRYENGEFQETHYFRSRAEGVRWLRTQGCRVREESTCHLGKESAVFTNGALYYEMEEDVIKNGKRG